MDEFPSGYTGMGNNPANFTDPTGMYLSGMSQNGTREGESSRQQNPFMGEEGHISRPDDFTLYYFSDEQVELRGGGGGGYSGSNTSAQGKSDAASSEATNMLPELKVTGKRTNPYYHWDAWLSQMQNYFGNNNRIDQAAMENFAHRQDMNDPYYRAWYGGYMPFSPDAVAITIPVTVMGAVGYSGSLNFGFVGGHFGVWFNGGMAGGIPEVSLGAGITMGEYKGRGVPTFDSYMGHGKSVNAGIGLFSTGYSRGYANYNDPDHTWNSYYGGISFGSPYLIALPSLNYSPLNYSWGKSW